MWLPMMDGTLHTAHQAVVATLEALCGLWTGLASSTACILKLEVWCLLTPDPAAEMPMPHLELTSL